jgi:hypothetical protein
VYITTLDFPQTFSSLAILQNYPFLRVVHDSVPVAFALGCASVVRDSRTLYVGPYRLVRLDYLGVERTKLADWAVILLPQRSSGYLHGRPSAYLCIGLLAATFVRHTIVIIADLNCG